MRGPRLILVTNYNFEKCQIGLIHNCADVRPVTGNGETATDITK